MFGVHSSPGTVIPELIEIFQEDDGSRSLVAGDPLSRFGTDALPPFIDALKNESDEDRKTEITSFLIKIGEDAIPELIAALGDEDIAPYSMAALQCHRRACCSCTSSISQKFRPGCTAVCNPCPNQDWSASGSSFLCL